MFDEEVLRFWKALQTHEVQYILIGDECLQMASIADIEGTSIPFLHINQLITNKKVINRPKDQIDVLALEQIRRLRDDC